MIPGCTNRVREREVTVDLLGTRQDKFFEFFFFNGDLNQSLDHPDICYTNFGIYRLKRSGFRNPIFLQGFTKK